MAIDFLYPQYAVVRNYDRCICSRACERQCANEVHFYDPAAWRCARPVPLKS